MNLKNKILVIAVAIVLAVGSGSAIAVITTRRTTPSKQNTDKERSTIQAAGETETTQKSFYTTPDGETVTFPVPDGTLQSAGQTTEGKPGLFSFGDNTVKDVVTTVTAAATTKATKPSTTSGKGNTTTTKQNEKPSSTTTAPTVTTTAAVNSDYEYAYAGLNPTRIEITDSNFNTVLINRDYILPDDYVPQLADAVRGSSFGIKLDYRVAPHYDEMYQAAKADGIYLTPVSGYRSLERQRNNLNNKIDFYRNQGYNKVDATLKAVERILPPGSSEHNAGLAMDIITADSTAGFQYTKEYKWLDEHAADYGFILRYPENKQGITKVIYEPWHWRYVGVKAAKEMKASGQTLEEYLGKVS